MEEYEGEGEDAGLNNPVGEYHGHRNDKNERHGRGRALLPNGDLYLGCYYRGQRHGLGIYRYKKGNGARYGGDWVFGVKQGWGTMYYPDASQYTGNWDRNDKHGWGVYVYPNGDEYEGWWYRGKKNGDGIFRTKATGEKFVGKWILGQRQGPGMIIRPTHRFIGNFVNDIPKGEGVYIFPELGCEQKGRYTVLKLKPGSEERYTAAGYLVRNRRVAPPPADPVELEKEKQAKLMTGEIPGEGGEPLTPGTAKPSKIALEANGEMEGEDATARLDPANEIYTFMKATIATEMENDIITEPVVAMWRATGITPLMTPIPNELVPPPPMPETPKPPEPEVEVELGTTEAEKPPEEDQEDPIERARRLAMTHVLKDAYLGQGVCQGAEVEVKVPPKPDEEPYSRFSQVDLSNLDELRAILDASGNQLEALDVEAMFKSGKYNKAQGMDVADRWRNCLGNDATCVIPQVQGAPEENTPEESGEQEAEEESEEATEEEEEEEEETEADEIEEEEETTV